MNYARIEHRSDHLKKEALADFEELQFERSEQARMSQTRTPMKTSIGLQL